MEDGMLKAGELSLRVFLIFFWLDDHGVLSFTSVKVDSISLIFFKKSIRTGISFFLPISHFFYRYLGDSI